jgi:hypothetical protein
MEMTTAQRQSETSCEAGDIVGRLGGAGVGFDVGTLAGCSRVGFEVGALVG